MCENAAIRLGSTITRAAAFAALLAWPASALADPPIVRWTPSLTAALHTRTRGDTSVVGAFDLHAEVFFGRDTRAPRPGLAVEGRVTTDAEIAGALRASLAVPFGRSDTSPTLTLTAGGALHARDALDPAGFARVWFGLRTIPDGSSTYEIAFGLWSEARYHPRDGAVDVLVGLSVDPWALSLPIVYLASAFTSRSRP